MNVLDEDPGNIVDSHPHAPQMAGVAWLSHNMIIGCLTGSFSVMLASVEHRMGVSREMSSSVGALLIFGSALMASVVGPLMATQSLRKLMLIGALAAMAGFLVLAFTTSYALYVGCYLLLFGPSMAICGSVGPATLVTRWFTRNRGLALGFVHVNLVVAIMPVFSNWLLEAHGARAVYLLLAALIGLGLVPATFGIRDYPPAASAPRVESAVHSRPPENSLTSGEIARTPAFWSLAIAAGAVITAIMVITFNMIPLAQSLGIDRAHGALLASIMAFSGMAGSVLFGWVADRIGGARGLALVAFDSAILFLALQIPDLSFAVRAVIIGLFGLHGAGMIPNVSRALAHSLGKNSFSRAFGLQTTLAVPMATIGIWAMGAAFTHLGTYRPVLIGISVLLAIASPLAFSAARHSYVPRRAASD